jgi:hypothetical protein
VVEGDGFFSFVVLVVQSVFQKIVLRFSSRNVLDASVIITHSAAAGVGPSGRTPKVPLGRAQNSLG